MLVFLHAERKDFRMLVKVFSEVHEKWEGIALCLGIAHSTENSEEKGKMMLLLGI